MTHNNIIEISFTPASTDVQTLLNGLNQEAYQAKGLEPMQPFGIFIRDSSNKILGGAHGSFYYGCTYVDLLWIDKMHRHSGFGTTIMKKIEEVALEKNCPLLTVTTMDWEALEFYQGLGYEIEFVREGYHKNSKMFLLKKHLGSTN